MPCTDRIPTAPTTYLLLVQTLEGAHNLVSSLQVRRVKIDLEESLSRMISRENDGLVGTSIEASTFNCAQVPLEKSQTRRKTFLYPNCFPRQMEWACTLNTGDRVRVSQVGLPCACCACQSMRSLKHRTEAHSLYAVQVRLLQWTNEL